MKRIDFSPLILAFFTVLVLFSAVACQRAKQFDTLGDIPDNGDTTSTGTTTVKTTFPLKAANQIQASVPTAITTCNSLAGLSISVWSACYPTVSDADQASTQCVGALGALNNAICANMQNRINAAKSACGSLFTQYRNYLPGPCITAVGKI